MHPVGKRPLNPPQASHCCSGPAAPEQNTKQSDWSSVRGIVRGILDMSAIMRTLILSIILIPLVTHGIETSWVLPREKNRTAPVLKVSPFELPPKIENRTTSYYVVAIFNTNIESVPVLDLIVKVYLPQNIVNVKAFPLIPMYTAGGVQTEAVRSVVGPPYTAVEQEPLESPLAQSCIFSPEKVRTTKFLPNGEISTTEIKNTNVLTVSCGVWPQVIAFSGRIDADSQDLDFASKPRAGRYEGQYSYEVMGRRFTETIEGSVTSLSGGG